MSAGRLALIAGNKAQIKKYGCANRNVDTRLNLGDGETLKALWISILTMGIWICGESFGACATMRWT
ncbi:hypothetical protein FIL88_07420 [Aliiroseovarius halocynthiae]|uniref:Uncharacterized protein n=1 Tax=Aliiroseovarius halocynthiae TaxID=985055 RepID=A0A545SWN6_9RHOB|nr:hypothetical protein FIL88_07420 [Aliiroseovarius halocynthiae]